MNGAAHAVAMGDLHPEKVQHASIAKRRKTETHTRDVLHGPSDGVDRPEDVEVGMMQLETEEVLSELTVRHEDETAVNGLLQRLVYDLPKLPTAQVDAAPVKGFLKDVGFDLQVCFDICHIAT